MDFTFDLIISPGSDDILAATEPKMVVERDDAGVSGPVLLHIALVRAHPQFCVVSLGLQKNDLKITDRNGTYGTNLAFNSPFQNVQPRPAVACQPS